MPCRLRDIGSIVRAVAIPPRRPEQRVDVLLVCSPGGHALQLALLDDAWAGRTRAWVTLDQEDTRSLLKDEAVYYAYGPTTRNVANLVRNLWLAFRLLAGLRPRLIVTTGAAVAVPFAWIGRLSGSKVVYVESVTRIERPSLSCRLIAPAASRLYVQWPELARALPRARYAGSVLGSR
jgi:UDP-N-acetylglucosamine:LPS N-acetylglucosamine transferase